MRRGAYETPQDLDSLQDTLASPDRSDGATADELRAALSSLPESQRKALLLREWRGFSYDEIGSELGLSQAATEALLFRARQNVAQRLGAGLKTLQGLPVFSFLRDLLQSAAAKIIAVGAGAALAVVTVPAAEHQLPGSAPAAPAVVHVDGATTRAPAARPRSDVGAPSSPARHDASVPARASAATTTWPRHRATATAVARPTSTPAPTTSAPPATPPVDATPAATGDDPVHNVVDTASDVGESLGLPPVTVPGVTTPTVTLPVDLPTSPPVQIHLP
jgi:Sigma-70, region 4